MMPGGLVAVAEQGVSFSQGGDFFTQLVFTVMATIAFSSHVIDFLVVKKDEDAERLHKDIQEELDKDLIFEEQNQQYAESHEKVGKLIKKNDKCKRIVVCVSRVYAWICLIAAFALLITGKATDVGCLPLLAFLPIGAARWILNKILGNINAELRNEKTVFCALQVAYNAKTRKLEKQADSYVEEALNKRKVDGPRKKKKAEQTTCSGEVN